MADVKETLRDWHRLFGLLLTDFFSGSPFTVEIERDLSQQQQLLDVVIVRRRRGRFAGTLPDGLDDLAEHNLITFKSHREALDGWAIRELLAHYVAYRKLVSPAPSDLLDENRFRLYAICARFPDKLFGQAPWKESQAGVYHCQWGLDTIRVVVAGRLPREVRNAPLHLFSAAPELVGFAGGIYRRRSEYTSRLIGELFDNLRTEGYAVSYTMEDFNRYYLKKHFARLTPAERLELLRLLPSEERREFLHSLSSEDRREFLHSLSSEDCLELLRSLSSEDRREFLRSLLLEDSREILRSLPPDEQEELARSLPPERRLAGLSEEQIRQYLDGLHAGRPAAPRRPRRKKK